jgi:DNA-binding transcriptional regulator GbsR (MarR family)
MNRTEKQKELVETMGRAFEKDGFQPIAGRIIGLLIVTDKEELTFDEIVEELQISKGSASTVIRMLELRNAIEYVTRPGDRKRYFRIKKMNRFNLIDEYSAKLNETRNYLQKAYELKADKNSENAIFIHDLIGMMNFMMDRFQFLKQEYQAGK